MKPDGSIGSKERNFITVGKRNTEPASFLFQKYDLAGIPIPGLRNLIWI
jgi:hypothetical protein